MNTEKKTLYVYGDSFTDGHRKDSAFTWFVKWYEYGGNYLPPNWFELLSDKLDCNYKNYGYIGNSNSQIFESFCKSCHEIKKGDIVIIEWTYNTRFRWAIDGGNPNQGHWLTVSILTKNNNYDPTHITNTTMDEIIVNRSHRLYVDELVNYENLIEQYALSKGFQIYFWALDTQNIYNQPIEKLKQKKYICHDLLIENYERLNEMYLNKEFSILIKYARFVKGAKWINEETNDVIGDGSHFGATGHKILAEMFYDYIQKINKLI